MTLEHAAGRLMEFMETNELNWDAQYAEQAPRIYNYFRFRLGSESDVEELTSRTFERAWRSRGRYRRDLAGFATWLFTIAQNVGTDYLRARRQHLPLDAAVDVTAEGTPEQHAEQRSNLARLALLCAALPPRERELVALKYGAVINNRMIAQLTGLSESNVGTILHRVVAMLREQW
ncbi:MAG TPA: sigma-70 family RNA polymerase sigma factor [Steroidobacteraceae bacterium]|nr:sigma-70 family RNA polymerase sigma factor [Steroidobacteraceae bacterium]